MNKTYADTPRNEEVEIVEENQTNSKMAREDDPTKFVNEEDEKLV
eukprot:CAMPEP_0116898966 /NCGR_PEP_ID=MMETSP0467-20121206/7611_1 /TAXON_ID=283647 /ORGANISM="Mesodinium pulex, Strain SPMC105" /LENGTH=44 /DNA_ID= /DNA_START= /DNA_END= /DNA_ORIENTATION=